MSEYPTTGRLPHPSLPWALFWIAGYIGFTQIPAALLAVGCSTHAAGSTQRVRAASE